MQELYMMLWTPYFLLKRYTFGYDTCIVNFLALLQFIVFIPGIWWICNFYKINSYNAFILFTHSMVYQMGTDNSILYCKLIACRWSDKPNGNKLEDLYNYHIISIYVSNLIHQYLFCVKNSAMYFSIVWMWNC